MRLRSEDKHYLRKSADRKAQISPVSGTNAFLICGFRSADFLRRCSYPPRATSRTISFLFPIVFGINIFSVCVELVSEFSWQGALLLESIFIVHNSSMRPLEQKWWWRGTLGGGDGGDGGEGGGVKFWTAILSEKPTPARVRSLRSFIMIGRLTS